MRIEAPTDPRLAPFVRLRSLMPLVEDKEARVEQRLLHRLALRDRVK